MAKETGIKWTDSTYNSWWGCTKVGPACDHCYAEGVDKRTGENHWGHDAPRRQMSEHSRNEPYRWQKKADQFETEHGRRRRVFTLSMGDLFDNEVDDAWRADHFKTMRECDRLEWQICTKRVSNIEKMVPDAWRGKMMAGALYGSWPRHIGVLITVVTQAEYDRDAPRLDALKRAHGIPWIGLSYEPAQEGIDLMKPAKDGQSLIHNIDWVIFGGKSGANWNDRPFSLDWARQTRDQCAEAGTAFFMKQVAAFRPTDEMIPADLMIRQWPEGH